jgi:DNA (cytosine-5)-methyltransferase 1
MTCGHLFNGIGGFALAAYWMGWENYMHCEIDPFCNRVMRHHFPKSIQHEDIRKTGFTVYRGSIDILTGGDPCQPNSQAGLRKGKDDDRYLWPEYLRAVKEGLPWWLVNENVSGSITNGILDQKISDLEAEGYTCWPPIVIPAGAAGAIHRRDRIWLVANAYGKRFQKRDTTAFSEKQAEGNVWNNSERLIKYGAETWDSSVSEILREADGLSEGLSANERNAGIKAMGNAIYPQVAFQIFKAIEQYDLQSAAADNGVDRI